MISLVSPEESYQLWSIVRVFDYKWLPSQVLDEDDHIISDLLELESLYQAARSILKKQKDDKKGT